MKLYLTRAACLLPLVLTACTHKNQVQNQLPLAPPVEDAPLSKPDNAPANLPPTVVSVPTSKPATTANNQQQQPKPATKPHKPKPAAKPASTTTPTTTASTSTTPPAAAPAPPPTQQQASTGTEEVSAIGKLSTGESGDQRAQTESSLAGTERSLNSLNRKLSDAEEKTSAQIREYIKQARTALSTNDLDGARTLATKAKLLLSELTQ